MSGRRNETARARRRQLLKETMSLTSVPRSEENANGTLPIRTTTQPTTLTLDNHFGWTVLQKSQIGDATFPHLFQYYEKPDLHGRDFDKVTYVLYMDKGTVVDKNTTLTGQKYTQTVVSGIQIPEEPSNVSTPGDYYDNTQYDEQTYEREIPFQKPDVTLEREPKIITIPERSRRKKKKLIREFYKRDRSLSAPYYRKQGGYSDAEYSEWQTPEVSNTRWSQVDYDVSDMRENDRTALILKEIKREKENTVDRSKDCHHVRDRVQLRAGAENLERGYKTSQKQIENTPPIMKKNNSKVGGYIKCKPENNGFAEELLKTSSGTNQYLYVSGRKMQIHER